MLSLAAGFLLLMVEVRWEHREAITEKSIALVPIIYSLVAAILCLVALSQNVVVRKVVAVVLACGLVVGFLGLREHTDGEYTPALRVLQPFGYKMPEEWGRRRGGGPPALAPLSMAGFGLLGAILVWPKNGKKQS